MEKGYQSVKLKKSTVDMLRRDGSSYSVTIEKLVNGECNMVSHSTHTALCKSLNVSADTPLDELLSSYVIGQHNEAVSALNPVGSNINKSLLDLGMDKQYALTKAQTASTLAAKEPSAAIILLVKHLTVALARITKLEGN